MVRVRYKYVFALAMAGELEAALAVGEKADFADAEVGEMALGFGTDDRRVFAICYSWVVFSSNLRKRVPLTH